MKTAAINTFLGLAALMLAACGISEKIADASTSTSFTKPVAAAPTADALLALEKQANAAYFSSDSTFFERILSDKFVMREGGRQMDKAAVVKWIAANKCNVKDWKLDDPQMARIARVHGPVVLAAIIGKDGTIQNLHVLSTASPLLNQAAIEAVQQWRYRPYVLNNTPVEVDTQITVNFTMSGS